MALIDDLIRQVAIRAGCEREDVEWYSWPQAFGTTAGPGGVGGSTMSTFQVFAFDAPGERSRYCGGKWRAWNGEFCQPW